MREPPSAQRRTVPNGWSPLLLPLLLLAGCSGLSEVPPITAAPSTEHHPGKFVRHDLLSEDPAAAQRFYADLFDWDFESIATRGDGAYILIRQHGRPIGGIVDARDIDRARNVSRWIPVLSVADVDDAVTHTLVSCKGGGVYANVGISGPTVDLGPVSLHTGVSLGRFL